MSGLGVISEEPMRVCELCGVIDECRPYGPNKEQVCYECGCKDPEAMQRGFDAYVLGGEDE